MITLKTVLRANATSCIIFGFIFLLIPTKIALFLNDKDVLPDTAIIILGAVLLLNGIHLLWASFREYPSKYLILYFSAGDFIWTICSIVLLILGTWITTTLGVITSILVAVMVSVFGLLQIIKRREMCNDSCIDEPLR